MRTYPAKLLLFGEHVLLLGASALAVPAPAWSARWVLNGDRGPSLKHREIMLKLADSKALSDIPGLDTERLKADILSGWFFQSNIQTGYGLGSSGALCAGIYDRYATRKTTDMAALKITFGQMESFFHGASSGIDPLTSYLDSPLLIRHKTEVSKVHPALWESEPVIFLLDTQIPRQTGPLVQWFLQQCEQPVFAERLQSALLPAHESMLNAWLTADAESFWKYLEQVSAFQLAHFQPMIPDQMYSLWEKSLASPDFYLKICGAGGGGFILGFARNREVVEGLSERYPIVLPFENIPRPAHEK